MTNEPLVSVVIATYNMGQYLGEAVESVLGQTWKNLEIIIVDDGSTDDTPDVIKRFKNNRRVRYISTENQGQPRAKNRGLKEAVGEYLGFCDADDLWQPDKLQLQMPAFLDSNVGVVYSDVKYINENGFEVNKIQPYSRFSGHVTKQLMIKNFIPFGTAIIRRECVEKNGYFDQDLPMGIDWDLWLRYSVDWNFNYIQHKTYAYRIWSGQMSNNYRGRYDNAFKILKKFINDHPEIIDEKVASRAWADMYVSRGMSIANAEKTFFEPIKDILTGIRNDTMYLPAWRSLLKLIAKKY